MAKSLHKLLRLMLYKYTVVVVMILIVGEPMRNLSFANYILRCRTNPQLAQKSAFDMYLRYQRAQVRPRWLNTLLLWR